MEITVTPNKDLAAGRTRRRTRWWLPDTREARVHAAFLAVILWGFAAATFVMTPGSRAFTGRLKTGDFVHWYTLGTIVLRGDTAELSDMAAMHATQVELLPESDEEQYVPAYPPSAALVFAPLALLPYGIAYLVWSLITAGVYVWTILISWSRAPIVADRKMVALAAIAFPPFWNLVLHGQTTVFPFAAFVLAWLALERRREWLAGLAFSLVGLKPQWGLLVAVVLLVARQWRSVAGILAGVAIQVVAVSFVLGVDAWTDYVATLRNFPRIAHLLEPYPHQMHSVWTLTRLLPAGAIVGVVASAVIAWLTVRMWRRADISVTVKMGVLVLGSILVNPHVSLYDLTIFALPALWCGGWLASQNEARRAELGAIVYGMYFCTLFPTARFAAIQGSVLLMSWLFWISTRRSALTTYAH